MDIEEIAKQVVNIVLSGARDAGMEYPEYGNPTLLKIELRQDVADYLESVL